MEIHWNSKKANQKPPQPAVYDMTYNNLRKRFLIFRNKNQKQKTWKKIEGKNLSSNN